MKRALLGLFVACTTLGLASVALAGENAHAGISLHITKPTAKAVNCAAFAYKTGSDQPFDVKGMPCPKGVGNFDVWVVVCNGSDSLGIAGAEFGLAYDGASGSGVDVNSWRSCTDLEFPQDGWPNAGTGNLVTWEPSGNCQVQDLVLAHPGAFEAYAVIGVMNVQVYGQDQMQVTPRPGNYLKVADCNAVEDDLTGAVPQRGGVAVFCGNRQGYNYCRGGVLAGGPTTWGAIKNLYSN